MTKKANEILKNSSIEANKKISLKITKKNNSKPTKKVILETPILEQASNKISKKRIISRKKTEQKTAVVSLSDVKKETVLAQNITTNVVQPAKKASKPHKKENTSLKPVTPRPNSQKNSHLLATKQILVKPKRTLSLHIDKQENKKQTPTTDLNKINEKAKLMTGFVDVPVVEASSIPEKKEITINQNSSFFYEPSVFQKFNIEVSNLTDKNDEISPSEEDISNVSEEKTSEDAIQNSSGKNIFEDDVQNNSEETVSEDDIQNNSEGNISEDESDSEENIIDEISDEDLVSALLDEIPELISESLEEDNLEITPSSEKANMKDDFDFVSNDIPAEFKEEAEKEHNLSEQKQKFVEDSSCEYDFISTETPNIYNSFYNENINLAEEPSKPVDFETSSIQEAADSLNSSNLLEENADTLNSNNDFKEIANDLNSDNVIKEVADNLITDNILKETKEVADNAVGKFFDSSIPNMANNTDNSYFKKIKKSIFSNMPNVFKKFSYEEATLMNLEEEFEEESANNSPNLELPQSAIQANNITPVVENLGNNDNIISNIDVSAQANTLVIPSVDEKILEKNEPSDSLSQDVLTNVIMPQSPEISSDDISLDDIDFSDLDVSDIENILNEDSNVNENEANYDIENTPSDLENLSSEEIDKELEEELGISRRRNY